MIRIRKIDRSSLSNGPFSFYHTSVSFVKWKFLILIHPKLSLDN
jgi:hypothetical protein